MCIQVQGLEFFQIYHAQKKRGDMLVYAKESLP